jgi:hypothetical protein
MHIATFLSVVLITEKLEICIQTSYDQNVQLILKSYLPVVYGTTLNIVFENMEFVLFHQKNKKIKRADQILLEVYGTTLRINLISN